MEADRQNTLELFKIMINSEDGKVAPGGDGADEEIGVGALNAFASRQIEKKGGLFEVFGGDWYIGEGGKIVLELFKLPLGFDAGENLLPHRADDADACFADQLFELFKVGNLRAGRMAAQGQRPDAVSTRTFTAFAAVSCNRSRCRTQLG